MTVLVTGGAGFIGSALVRHLVRMAREPIVTVDALTYSGNLASLDEIVGSPHHIFHRADICDGAAMTDLLERHRPRAIMHLAAESHVDRSIDGPAAFIQTNVVGTFTLLEAARHYWRALPEDERAAFRFLHVSTDEVYGALGPEGLFHEDSPYAPNSPYAASKASSDHLAMAWQTTYGLPVVVSNCSNNYGPYQFPEKLIPTVILAALEGRPIPVYGTGDNVRDWLYVEDHVEALCRVLADGRPGQSYNVGGGAELRNLDLIRLICTILDEELPESPHRPHDQLISFVTDRPGHDFRYAIDPGKIRNELNWTPQTTVTDGMRATVRWYLANQSWWQPIRDSHYDGGRLGLSR